MKENYQDYLKSEHWKQRRKTFKSSRTSKCFLCSKMYLIQVHHKTYYRNGESVLYNEIDDDLMLLCKSCHQDIHEYNLEGVLRSNLEDNEKIRRIKEEIKKRKNSIKTTYYPPSKKWKKYNKRKAKKEYKYKF